MAYQKTYHFDLTQLDQYPPQELDLLYISLRNKSLRNRDDAQTQEYLKKLTLISLEKTLASLNIKKDSYTLSCPDDDTELEIRIPGPEDRTLDLIHYSDKLRFKCEIYERKSKSRKSWIIEHIHLTKNKLPDNLICYLHLEGPPYSALSDAWTLAQLPVETIIKMNNCLMEGRCQDYTISDALNAAMSQR